MTQYTPNRNWPYPDQGTKPYYTDIQATFNAMDADVAAIDAASASHNYDTIGTTGAPGELRLEQGSAGAVAHVKGFWDANDGGGGLFNWVLDATPPTDDGGTIIVPTGTPTGYWQRQYEGQIINAKWFGCRAANPDNGLYLNQILTAVSTNQTTIRMPQDPGVATTTYDFTTSVTIPVTVEFIIENGVLLDIGAASVFTINGTLYAGRYRIFDVTGTLTINGDKTPNVFPEWWFDGGSNWTPAIQSACDAVYTSGGRVELSAGEYQTTTTIKIRNGVEIRGIGAARTFINFRPASNIAAFEPNEDIGFPADNVSHRVLTGFTVDLSDTQDCTGVKWTDDMSMCIFEDIAFEGNENRSHIAWHIPLPSTPLNLHNNKWIYCSFVNCRHADGAFQVFGDFTTSKQFNNNLFFGCRFGKNTTHLRSCGIGNVLDSCVAGRTYPLTPGPVKKDNSTGRYFTFIFKEAGEHTIRNCFFDNSQDNVLCWAEGQDPNSFAPVIMQGNVGFITEDQVYHTFKNSGSFSASQLSTTQFRITGSDQTSVFYAGRTCYMDLGATDGWVYSKVTSSTFTGGNTDVTVADAVITANLTTVYPASVAQPFARNRYLMGEFELDFGTINANSSKALYATIEGLYTNWAISLDSLTLVNNTDIGFQSWAINTTNSLRVRLRNYTGSNVAIGTVSFHFLAMRENEPF